MCVKKLIHPFRLSVLQPEILSRHDLRRNRFHMIGNLYFSGGILDNSFLDKVISITWSTNLEIPFFLTVNRPFFSFISALAIKVPIKTFFLADDEMFINPPGPTYSVTLSPLFETFTFPCESTCRIPKTVMSRFSL